MPAIDESLEKDSLCRILIYGAAKTRKTFWALRAAELGFNVILADLDHGFHIAQALTPEARRRIYRLDMRSPEADYNNGGAYVLANAVQGKATLFDEDARKYVAASRVEETKSYVRLDLNNLTSKDVLVLDSWTAFYTQLAAGTRNVVDPSIVDKLEWDDIQKLRLVLDHFIQGLTKLPCHVIVIGHGEEWAKRKADAPAKAKPEDAIEAVKTQPMSITRPHAATLAKNFTDVLYFEVPNSMQGTMISTKGGEDFAAGSRRFPDSIKKFDDLSFATFVAPEDLRLVATNSAFKTEGLVEVAGSEIAAQRSASKPGITVGKAPITLNRKV